MTIFDQTPVIRILITAGVTILITLLVRWILYRFIPPLLARQSPLWEDILAKHRVLRYFYLSIPGVVVAGLVQITPNINSGVATIIYKVSVIYSVLLITRGIIAALRAYNDFYDQYYEFAKEVPIKTVVQTTIVLIAIFCILIIIAILLDVPLLALAGVMAAIFAVASYLFSDPLLGFSASLQLSMNQMLAIGDWLEMDEFGADGVVEDINVTSTKVRNWDNVIVNVPTSALVKNSFRNWRSMQSREARRVLRPINIDQNSIAFASPAQITQKLAQLAELYEKSPVEMQQKQQIQPVLPRALQQREQLTNLELFMAYTTLIVAGHPQTRADYDLYVRQQDPSPQGLPVELFFFTRATDFVPYYAVQREIFSHLLAVLPEFDLRPYQVASGRWQAPL